MKPVIIGMCNPQGNPPFWHEPANGSGARLLAASGLTVDEYLSAFIRLNVLDEPEWDPHKARLRGPSIWREIQWHPVIVCGRETAHALGLRASEPLVRQPPEWWFLPHPSGRSRWWNDDACVAVASFLLAELGAQGLAV